MCGRIREGVRKRTYNSGFAFGFGKKIKIDASFCMILLIGLK